MINELNQKEIDYVHGGFTAPKEYVALVLYTMSFLIFTTSFIGGFYCNKQQIKSDITLDAFLRLSITIAGIAIRITYKKIKPTVIRPPTSNYKTLV